MTPVTEFTIKRSVWLRKDSKSYLLREDDNKQCCVGIYLQACGLPPERLRGVDSASSNKLRDCDIPSWLVFGDDNISNSDLAGKLYEENDDFGDEAKIAELFKRAGVTVHFED